MTPQDIKETHISDLYNIDHCTHVQKPMRVNSYNWPLTHTFYFQYRSCISECVCKVSDRYDTNRALQSQKTVRGLKFIKEVDVVGKIFSL